MKTNEAAQNNAQGKENATAKATTTTAVSASETAKAKVLSIREQLEKELEKLNRRKELADKREFFLNKKQELLKYKKYVVKDLGEMETKHARISFIGIGEYGRDEEKVNVNNPDFIARYIDNLIADIDRTVIKIESELLTEAA